MVDTWWVRPGQDQKTKLLCVLQAMSQHSSGWLQQQDDGVFVVQKDGLLDRLVCFLSLMPFRFVARMAS